MGAATNTRKLWLRFLGGLFVTSVIMYFVLMGLAKTIEMLEKSFYPEGLPEIMNFGLAVVVMAIGMALLSWTVGKYYKPLNEIRMQKKEMKKKKKIEKKKRNAEPSSP